MHSRGTAAASPGRFTTLDAMRGLASLFVLFYHVDDVLLSHTGTEPFGGLAHGLARGVDFLFVLSGYVMTRLYVLDERRKARAGGFLGQRARRLLPAFWLVSLAALLLYLAGFGGAEKAAKLEPINLASSFLLLPQNGYPLLNVSWFLVYEAFFYVVIALVLVDRRLGLGAMCLWQGLVLVLMAVGHDVGPSETPNYLNPRALGLGIGMAFAFLERRIAARVGTPGLMAAFAAAASVFLGDMLWEGTGERDTHGIPLPLLDLTVGVMLVAAATLEARGLWRGPRPLAAAGNVSYSVYLTHFAVLTVIVPASVAMGLAPGNALALACAALALSVGIAFHHGVDMPIQAVLRRSGGAPPRRLRAPAGAGHQVRGASYPPGAGG